MRCSAHPRVYINTHTRTRRPDQLFCVPVSRVKSRRMKGRKVTTSVFDTLQGNLKHRGKLSEGEGQTATQVNRTSACIGQMAVDGLLHILRRKIRSKNTERGLKTGQSRQKSLEQIGICSASCLGVFCRRDWKTVKYFLPSCNGEFCRRPSD